MRRCDIQRGKILSGKGTAGDFRSRNSDLLLFFPGLGVPRAHFPALPVGDPKLSLAVNRHSVKIALLRRIVNERGSVFDRAGRQIKVKTPQLFRRRVNVIKAAVIVGKADKSMVTIQSLPFASKFTSLERRPGRFGSIAKGV